NEQPLVTRIPGNPFEAHILEGADVEAQTVAFAKDDFICSGTDAHQMQAVVTLIRDDEHVSLDMRDPLRVPAADDRDPPQEIPVHRKLRGFRLAVDYGEEGT